MIDSGLPHEKSYDLVFRHALDISQTGKAMIMGSTTGNLWLSEDEGKNWHSISNYLPPIYGVWFVN